MIAVLYILAFALVVVGLGWLPVRCLDRSAILTDAERAASAFLVGALAVYLAVFVIGRWSLSLPVAGGLAVALVVGSIPGLMAMPWASWRHRLASGAVAVSQDRLLCVCWILTLLVALSSLLQGMAPPNDYDSLFYHLTVPRLDVERGVIVPEWKLGVAHAFFPQFMGNLYRLTLVLVGDRPVQMIHGLFGLLGAVVAARLTRRLGFGTGAALVAALLFLSIRGVVWQMATAEVDVALGAVAGLALLIYLAGRDDAPVGLMVLFGLAVGACLSIKPNGIPLALIFGLVLLWDGAARRGRLAIRVLVGPAAAFLVYLPHLVGTWLWTGNPFFPLLNDLFDPTGATFVTNLSDAPVWSLLYAWAAIFVLPTHLYDGMFFGSPLLLVLLAGLLLLRSPSPALVPCVLFAAAYYVFWWKLLSPQARFLVHIAPVLAACAALGGTMLWREAKPHPMLRRALLVLLTVLSATQLSFVAIYTPLRLPAAIGLMSAEDYHRKTPTLQGAHFAACRYVRDHLAAGETYLSLIIPHSYYCPQKAAVIDFFEDEDALWTRREVPEVSFEQFARRMRSEPFRFVIVGLGVESRINESRSPEVLPVDLGVFRIGRHVAPVLPQLTPLFIDKYAAVYDGRAVLEALGISR